MSIFNVFISLQKTKMPVFADVLPEPWFIYTPWVDAQFMLIYCIFMIIFCLYWIVCIRKMLKKAWLPGRWSIIPVYNTVLWFKLAWRSWIWALSILFPPLLLIMLIVTYFDIAKKFGKSWWFWVGLWLLNPIFMGILAFWKAEYQK